MRGDGEDVTRDGRDKEEKGGGLGRIPDKKGITKQWRWRRRRRKKCGK